MADHGRADEAALILEELLQAEPGCSSVRRVLGKIYIDLKRLDDAVCILQDSEDDVAVQSLLGTAYFKKGELDRARVIFEQLLLNEEMAEEMAMDARIKLAAIYARLGQPAKAAEYMMSALPG